MTVSEYDPNAQDDVETDNGIRSSDLGSFIPEGTYRPIPIVWFTAAYLIHSLSLVILFLGLSNQAPWFTWLTTLIISIAVARWTFQRGMNNASKGWQIATILALAVNWSLVALAASAN